jgi:hypothetical protein
MFGYNVANGPTNFYWASDLLHRLLHVPKVGEGVVEHYGHEGKYPGVMSLAKENSTYAVRNSDTLQYFALEVYAHDIAVPGIGCPGTYIPTPTPSATAAASSNAGATSSAIATSSPAVSSAAAAAKPSQAQEACTPHGDHWHCPPGVPEPTSPPS